MLPTLRVVPNPRVAQYARVEFDRLGAADRRHRFRIYVAGRVKKRATSRRMRSKINGKFWWEMTEEEHQRFPGDYEAQVGQGPITFHSEEHFGRAIAACLMLRRLLREQLDALAAGEDPVGVSFDPNAPPIVFEAGNYIRDN